MKAGIVYYGKNLVGGMNTGMLVRTNGDEAILVDSRGNEFVVLTNTLKKVTVK